MENVWLFEMLNFIHHDDFFRELAWSNFTMMKSYLTWNLVNFDRNHDCKMPNVMFRIEKSY
jgi:hypothetical protein